MVAIMRSNTVTATNLVRRNQRATPPDARARPRTPVSLRMWLCADAFSARGFALDLSEDGARIGGMGVRFQPGERVIAKIVVEEHEPPLVLRAQVLRYQPHPIHLVPAGRAQGCPELCIRFVEASLEDRFRLGRLLDRG